MGLKQKHGAGILRASAILLVLPAVACAFAADQIQEAETPALRADTAMSQPDPEGTSRISRALTGSGLHVEIGGSHAQYLHLSEPFQFNPAVNPAAPTSTGWERSWQEDRAWLRVTYGFRVGGHLLFQPGLVLGVARGRFAASSADNGVSEEWLTRLAPLGGLSFAAEVHAEPAQGPFLMMQYQSSRAEAAEANETLVSDSRANPDDRDARFLWLENDAILGVGWRWGSLRPMAGIAHTEVRLKKWLRHHIPEADVSGFDLELIRALNSVESEYHFENKNPWAPFLELGWQATPTWALVVQATMTGRDGYSASLRALF